MSAEQSATEARQHLLGLTSVEAIVEGRRASGNMTKYLLMGTSSNFGNVFSMAVASVFLPSSRCCRPRSC
jgi:hypothetical protein